MADNQSKFNDIHHTLTGGQAGVKDAGEVFVNTASAAADAAWLRNALTGGQAGVRSAGSIIGLLAQIDGNVSASKIVTENLVTALANVSGGEDFDEAKLLESISAATEAAFTRALKTAAPAEVVLKIEGEK